MRLIAALAFALAACATAVPPAAVPAVDPVAAAGAKEAAAKEAALKEAALQEATAKAAALEAAAKLRGIESGDLDTKAAPCDDFFQYANGAWRAQNPIPPSMPRWSRRWAAGESNKDQLKRILEEVSAKSDWPHGSVEQQIGDFYAGCMDEKKVDAEGLAALQPLLGAIAAIKTPADVQAQVARLHALGVPALFRFGAQSDYHQPSQVIGDLGPAGLGLPDRDYYLKPEPRFVEARAKYRAHVTAMFKLAGEPAKTAQRSSDAVFELETRLAKATLDLVAQRDPQNLDHKTTADELVKLAPHYDFKKYFEAAGLQGAALAAALNVEEPRFLQEVDAQLSKTPLAAWKAYLTWHLLHAWADQLATPFVTESFGFYSAFLGGAREQKPRWKRCAETADQLYGDALGRKYVEKHFPPAAKARMQDLVKNVLLAMGDSIRGLAWMSPETKARALEKLATFNPKIGYPDKWKDYSKVEVSRASHVANTLAGARFVVDDDLLQIGKEVDRGRWGMTPPTSNAYYNPLLNEIVFPAGILQPPAFSVEASDAVNYGAIGVVIGHEVSHGFDDQGAQFDAQGRLQNWWTAKDLAEFKQRGQCVVDQFESYFIEPGLHHNGKLVLGESIGDLAGARIAWLAFQRASAERPQATLGGFSPEQQFFIAWGQFRGDEIRAETQRQMVQGDPHPIGKYRVIGPLSNLPDFARVFGCKEGSAMVRPAANRCEIW